MTPTIASIKQAVAEHYGVPVRVMAGRSQAWSEAHPRQVAMCLAFRLTRHSKCRIGQFFGGRHCSTVRYAVEITEERARRDVAIQDAMRAVTLRLVRP